MRHLITVKLYMIALFAKYKLNFGEIAINLFYVDFKD